MAALPSRRARSGAGLVAVASGMVLSLMGFTVWVYLLPVGIMVLLLGTALVVLAALHDLSA